MAEPISTATLIRLGLLGGRAAGFNPIGGIASKLFGGGGHNQTLLPGLRISSQAPTIIQSQSQFIPQGDQIIPRNRFLGQALQERIKPVGRMMKLTEDRLRFLGFDDIATELRGFALNRSSSSPQGAINNIQEAINATISAESVIESRFDAISSSPESLQQFSELMGVSFDTFRSEFGRQAESNIMGRRVGIQSAGVSQKTKRLARFTAGPRGRGGSVTKSQRRQIPQIRSSLPGQKAELGRLQGEFTRLDVPIADISGLQGVFATNFGGQFKLPPQPGGPDFVGPVQEQPSQPRKVDKGRARRAALQAARSFIRVSRRGRDRVRTGGFVSRIGIGDISELEQEEDRIIPSGFISKQATTGNRALALNSLR